MISKSTILHLRLPFFLFLLPVFLFALAISGNWQNQKTILVFFILHFLLYPASNSFNSYYDRDENSIGLLEKPPAVKKELLWVSLSLDALAVLLSIFIGWRFALAVFIYGMASKLYSHPRFRLKKRPIASLLWVGIGQGFCVFITVCQAVTKIPFHTLLLNPEVLCAGLLGAAYLIGAYPMTQIYQHEEDKRHGDMTMSRLLGIRGTFIFTAIVYFLAAVGFILFFLLRSEGLKSLLYILFQIPPVLYFLVWLVKTFQDEKKADYRHAMQLNFLSSISLNVFFGILCFWRC